MGIKRCIRKCEKRGGTDCENHCIEKKRGKKEENSDIAESLANFGIRYAQFLLIMAIIGGIFLIVYGITMLSTPPKYSKKIDATVAEASCGIVKELSLIQI